MLQYPVLAIDTCGQVGTVALADLENGATTVTCVSGRSWADERPPRS